MAMEVIVNEVKKYPYLGKHREKETFALLIGMNKGLVLDDLGNLHYSYALNEEHYTRINGNIRFT